MGGMSDYLENAFLDEVFRNVDYTPAATAYASLHDGHPADTGANEVAGGSYGRVAITFAAAAGGIIDTSADVEFTGMPASTVLFWGIWDAAAAGNHLQWGEIVDDHTAPVRATFSALASTDTFTSYAHGMSNDDRVHVEQQFGSALPTGISEATNYWIVGVTADTFQLSLTQGGGAINITTDGEGIVLRFVAKTVNAGDTFRLPSGEVRVQVK